MLTSGKCEPWRTSSKIDSKFCLFLLFGIDLSDKKFRREEKIMYLSDTVPWITRTHLLQASICLLAIYLLRARNTYVLTPAWRKELDRSHFQNGKYPGQDERLPSPIVTDINGDGQTEIILINNELLLQILEPQVLDKDSVRLPHLKVLFSTRLPIVADEGGHKGHPVALETGFLDEFNSNVPNRSQAIVVVLDNWQVLCFDHNLASLWEQQVMDTVGVHENYATKAVGVLLTSYKLQRSDRGVVIVGGSFVHKSHSVSKRALGTRPEPDMRRRSNSLREDSTYTHFSTFALNGDDGTIRWHHLPGQFHRKELQDKEYHHWKLALRRGLWHTGESHWTKYADNILQHTPHQWHLLQDTSVGVVNLRKLEQGASTSARDDRLPPEPDSSPLVDLGLQDSHVMGLPFGGLPPHSRHEHVKNPNAVLIHNHQGIEVLSLESGRPVTRLLMDKEECAYADVNQDGGLDEVCINFRQDQCRAEASTVQPRSEKMFSVPVCRAAHWWGSGQSLQSALFSSVQVDEHTHVAIPPTLVNSVAKKTGLFNHLLGRGLPSERHGYDAIFLTSTGRMTSLGNDGHLNWQVVLASQWADKSRLMNLAGFENVPDSEIFMNAFRPSVASTSIQVYGKEEAVFVTGWNYITLVDLQDGFSLAEHTLPCQPLNTPIVADFNQDGFNDVIISCPSGYIGLVLERRPQVVYYVLVSVLVVLLMLFLSWCCQPSEPDTAD